MEETKSYFQVKFWMTQSVIMVDFLVTREQRINVKNEGFTKRMTASILLFYNSPL